MRDERDLSQQEQLQQLQQQLIELQTQLAFQEDAVQALDDVVIAQQHRLDQLAQHNLRLEKQLAEVLTSFDAQTPSEPPPHY
jgi:SlyX protein